ncbi:BON domain-containing protein [Kribbella sp. NBC_00359]|jgi:osmotically-inducible protein OsmY|uniref:BON domain-containing protein n=1 Tax=Kribbella sp. NBC_00359 TaxID=2975966 RepID=UPI002E1B894C
MTDEAVALNVKDELFWDPKVDSEEIAVSADDGTITLRGTVGSFRQKRDAKKAAERVHGVVYVDNELSVRILTKSRRADADLRGDVLQAMLLDSLIPTTVDAKIQDGYVTLSGAVDWQYQRDEATFVAGNVLGVTGVDNEIIVGGDAHTAGEVSDDIQKAFKRDAKIDADSLAVAASAGTVTLTGSVRSWSEHDAALAAAWAAPGVTTVNDRLVVSY